MPSKSSNKRSYDLNENRSGENGIEKRQKVILKCSACERAIHDESKVQCTEKTCRKWFHIIKCSGLSSVDARRKEVTNDYLCNNCDNVEETEDEMAVDCDESMDVKGLVLKLFTDFKKERSEMKTLILNLTKKVSDLESENMNIKKVLTNFVKNNATKNVPHNNLQNPLRSRTPSRGRLPSRGSQPNNARAGTSLGRGDRGRANSIVRWNQRGQFANNVNNRQQRHSKNGFDHNRRRKPNVFRAYRETNEENDCENKLRKSLAISNITLHRRSVFLNIPNSNATSEIVHKHLKDSNIAVDQVSRMKSKFSGGACFVIDCTDFEYNDMKNSDLWPDGTTVRDFIGERNNDYVLDSFPSSK